MLLIVFLCLNAVYILVAIKGCILPVFLFVFINKDVNCRPSCTTVKLVVIYQLIKT